MTDFIDLSQIPMADETAHHSALIDEHPHHRSGYSGTKSHPQLNDSLNQQALVDCVKKSPPKSGTGFSEETIEDNDPQLLLWLPQPGGGCLKDNYSDCSEHQSNQQLPTDLGFQASSTEDSVFLSPSSSKIGGKKDSSRRRLKGNGNAEGPRACEEMPHPASARRFIATPTFPGKSHIPIFFSETIKCTDNIMSRLHSYISIVNLVVYS